MKFNGGKFQVLRYGPNKDLNENTVYFTSNMEEVIEQESKVKDLGVILSDDTKFEEQVESVTKKANQKAGWICRTFYSREARFMIQTFNTLVQPHLDYCSQLWSPTGGILMNKIQNVLKNFLNKIPSMRSLNYWEKLKELKMNSMQRRLDRCKIIYTWKILENLVPNCGIQKEPTNERKGRQCEVIKHRSKVQSVKTLRENTFYTICPILVNFL